MKSIIAEFILRQPADAAELAQRAKVLAALTQLSPQRRNELAEAVNVVCRTIAAHGGKGKVRFSLITQNGRRVIEIAVSDLPADASDASASEADAHAPCRSSAAPWEAAVIQRVGELVDHFESSGWPVAGAVVRMAQTLPPAFALPTDAEVADWARILQSNTAFDALAYALRRARSLEKDLDVAQRQEQLRTALGDKASESSHLAMLSLVISKTKNAISILNPAGTIIDVNAAFVQMTGYTLQEAIGQTLCDLLFGANSDHVAIESYQRALQEGEELTQDILRYRKDGQTYWVESNLIPVRDGEGTLTQWILIDTDITRRHETEATLRAAKETAEKNNRLKSEFLANLSHEIRTPMNAIIGMTDLTLATDLTDQQREYLQTVRSSSEALLKLLNDILDLSKIEAGKMELEQTDFDLREVVHDTIRTLAVKAHEKGLTLHAQLADDLPRIVRGDPTKLRQVLLNLIGNAIKFTKQGDVTVSVELLDRQEEEMTLHFAVQDTGIGISSEKLDEIFHAFQQGDASTTRRFGGTGLGLTISSELVRIMRGRIWVDSAEGRGSTFHFTLQLRAGTPLALPPADSPARDAQVDGSQEQPSSASPSYRPGPRHAEMQDPSERPGRGPETPADHVARRGAATADDRDSWRSAPRVRALQVLVADDHAPNRQLVTTVLSIRGHVCTEATNGREALEVWQRGMFDVLLMDVQMPVMDGFQATAAIRKREEETGKHLPIIALTAHAMSGDREKCLAAGMDAYLAKPLRPRQLVEMVESVAELKPTRSVADRADSKGPGNDLPEFDMGYALESLDNDAELLVGQMEFFLQDAPDLLVGIEQAIRADDSHRLQLAAHRLKGMLARYAYQDAAAIAWQLEEMGESGQIQGADLRLRDLRPMVNRLAVAIQQYMAQT